MPQNPAPRSLIPKKPKTKKPETNYWSGRVTGHSNATDLDAGVFTWDDPKRIALSLKHSVETSTRLKGTPYQSAMSMLNFYMNRAGKNLKADRRKILTAAKAELKKVFGEA